MNGKFPIKAPAEEEESAAAEWEIALPKMLKWNSEGPTLRPSDHPAGWPGWQSRDRKGPAKDLSQTDWLRRQDGRTGQIHLALDAKWWQWMNPRGTCPISWHRPRHPSKEAVAKNRLCPSFAGWGLWFLRFHHSGCVANVLECPANQSCPVLAFCLLFFFLTGFAYWIMAFLIDGRKKGPWRNSP